MQRISLKVVVSSKYHNFGLHPIPVNTEYIADILGYLTSFYKKLSSPAQVMAAAQFVREAIANEPIVIFSKSDCGYCKMAKECFDKLKATTKSIELDKREDMDDIQDALEELTGARSVPRVFVNGVFIGGGSDVRKMSQNGKLQELLKI